jgi:hypothetical protein
VAERIRSIEKSSDLTGNRTCNHPVCSSMPQPIMLVHNCNKEINNTSMFTYAFQCIESVCS